MKLIENLEKKMDVPFFILCDECMNVVFTDVNADYAICQHCGAKTKVYQKFRDLYKECEIEYEQKRLRFMGKFYVIYLMVFYCFILIIFLKSKTPVTVDTVLFYGVGGLFGSLMGYYHFYRKYKKKTKELDNIRTE